MFPEQQIGILEWFLKDTEDWSNDAKSSALHHIWNKLHFKIY